MRKVVTGIFCYVMIFAMVLGIVNIGGAANVNAEVDANKDIIKMIAILMDEDLSVRQQVLELITNDEGNFDTAINEAATAILIGKVKLRSGAELSTKISVATIESGLRDAKTYYNTSQAYAAYVNYALDKLGEELTIFLDKETNSNELVAKIEKKALSYRLFLNFLCDIKEMTSLRPLDYYSSSKELRINPALEALAEALKNLPGFDQLARYNEYKELLVNDYLVEVNSWSNADEKAAFISDLNELALYNLKSGGDVPPPSGGGGGGDTTLPICRDGNVRIETNAAGEKIATVTINQDAVEDDIINPQEKNVSFDLAAIKGATAILTELTGAMMDKIADSKKGLEIKTENITITIPNEVVKQISDANGNEKIVISIKIVKDPAETTQGGLKVLGQVIDFSILVGDKAVTSFDKKVQVDMKVDMSKVTDNRKVIASYFNDTTKLWEPVNGHLNKQTGILTFFADHFSKYAAVEYTKRFSDVSTPWAKDSIEVLAARNIMNGIGGNRFAPTANITRAEVAAIIVRALGIETTATTGKFSDVASGKWYAKEVEAAERAGIVTGIGGSKFAPDAQVTREQIAAMIYRALEYKQGKTAVIPALSFTDAADISPYAKNAVAVVASKGIVKGSNNKFDPASKATREQVAVMLYRLLETLGEMSK